MILNLLTSTTCKLVSLKTARVYGPKDQNIDFVELSVQYTFGTNSLFLSAICCRNVGLGAGIFWARMGSILAPQILLLVS